jgi:quinol monooxygenase YgiN
MIVVIGEFRLPLEHRAEAEQAMARVVAATRAENGCIAYAYAEDVTDPGLFRVSELWESHEALAAHFAAPHMLAWQRERAELGMKDRKVTAYAVSGEELL